MKQSKGITLISLIITIIILLILSGIAIASLVGENGLIAKIEDAKKTQIKAEMKEQLTMALQELQIEKRGNATLDDVTQGWLDEIISKEYTTKLKEDASYSGKLIIMTKNKITGKFMIDQNLNIISMEYNINSVEIEYTTISRTDNKIKINIVFTDKINGIKQIDYPEGDPLKVTNGSKEPISMNYEVELGKEYKFIITSENGDKTEKIIKIDDYFYNITKTLGEGISIDNTAVKAAYNKPYQATLTTGNEYVIETFTVTMGGETVTVDKTTGIIDIEKVTGDIEITATAKKLEIVTTEAYINTTASATSSVEDNSQTIGKTLYINFSATLEKNACTIVNKDDGKSVPYAVTRNGKYTFVATGTYNGKTITKEVEVEVNKYKAATGLVKYDAGDWTYEDIYGEGGLNELKLYDTNIEKTINKTFKLNTSEGLNFTFGGFTYKEDTIKENKEAINNGTIITSRNQSISPENGGGTPFYNGWQILKSYEDESTGRTYVTKLVHAGCPENFVYYRIADKDQTAYRAVYLLSSGAKFGTYNTLSDGTEINKRNWNIYKDKELDKKEYIKEVHVMTLDEALELTGDTLATDGIRNTGTYYWLADKYEYNSYRRLYYVQDNGKIDSTSRNGCMGIRPIVTLNEGIYIASGSGTEADPYVLGKE